MNINYLKSEYTGKALLPDTLATLNICTKECPKTTQVMLINLEGTVSRNGSDCRCLQCCENDDVLHAIHAVQPAAA